MGVKRVARAVGRLVTVVVVVVVVDAAELAALAALVAFAALKLEGEEREERKCVAVCGSATVYRRRRDGRLGARLTFREGRLLGDLREMRGGDAYTVSEDAAGRLGPGLCFEVR